MSNTATSARRRRARRAVTCAAVLLVLFGLAGAPLAAAQGDLRLIEAVRSGDLAAVRELVARGVDVNQHIGDGQTALHWAAYTDNHDALDLLIRAGAAIDRANALGVTPLWGAAEQGNGAALARLLDAGANPNLAPLTGGTPLMLAARAGEAASVKLLLNHGAEVNAKEEANGQTALMWAVAHRHGDIVGLLLAAGADVHARSKSSRRVVLLCCPGWSGDPEGTVEIDQGGLTPLLFAALNGDVESARQLLDAGADVNETAAAGTTALVMSAHRGSVPLVTLLLERGADPDTAGGGYSALHSAVLRGDADMVDQLLAHGASVEVRLTKGTFLKRGSREFAFDKSLIGATPFLLAARLGDLSLVRRLVQAGADRSQRLEDGRTPLIVAVQGETTGSRVRPGAAAESRVRSTVTLLLELGADVNAVDHAGNTPLHMLAKRRPAFDSVIELLVHHGASLEPTNDQGETPLALALAPPAVIKGQSTTVQTIQWREQYEAWKANNGRTSTTDLLRKLGATK
jgi:uncharacterized protein